MVIAWLLAYWFTSKATNLAYYGIDTKVILTGVKKITGKAESNRT